MSTLICDFISDGTTTKSVTDILSPPSGDGSVSGWVQANGTGTAAVTGSFNNTSITDNGTGDYTFTHTNAFANDDYGAGAVAGDSGLNLFSSSRGSYIATGSFRSQTLDDAGVATDPDLLSHTFKGSG